MGLWTPTAYISRQRKQTLPSFSRISERSVLEAEYATVLIVPTVLLLLGQVVGITPNRESRTHARTYQYCRLRRHHLDCEDTIHNYRPVVDSESVPGLLGPFGRYEAQRSNPEMLWLRDAMEINIELSVETKI